MPDTGDPEEIYKEESVSGRLRLHDKHNEEE